jgi:antitoxin VapB
MTTSTNFKNNDKQALGLPVELSLSDSIKRVRVRVVGNECIISPVDLNWDSFFLSAPLISEDFMPKHANQEQPEWESLE